MTAQVTITNTGNCTGDIIEVYKDGEAKTDQTRLAKLERGQSYVTSMGEHGGLLFTSKNIGEFVDHPVLNVHDRPRRAGLD